MIRLLGALLLFVCGGYCGHLLCRNYRHQEKLLTDLQYILGWMEDQLNFRRSPLPQLLEDGAKLTDGQLQNVLITVQKLLEEKIYPDCRSCMDLALREQDQLPSNVRAILEELGCTLGYFDLQGQLNRIAWVKGECEKQLKRITEEKQGKLKTYQTLGLCAGAMLAVLLI